MMQKIDEKFEYDKVKKKTIQMNYASKQKLEKNLDDIKEASILLEDSNGFTVFHRKASKYLVGLLEDAWVKKQQRKKAKELRDVLKTIPNKARVKYIDLMTHRNNHINFS